MATHKHETMKPKVSSSPVGRFPKCSRCRNHGVISVLKGHKRFCQWRDCSCENCVILMKRQVNAKEQIAIRRHQKQDEALGIIVPVNSDDISEKLHRLIQRYPQYNIGKLNSVLKSCNEDIEEAIVKIDHTLTRAFEKLADQSDEQTYQVSAGIPYSGFHNYPTFAPPLLQPRPSLMSSCGSISSGSNSAFRFPASRHTQPTFHPNSAYVGNYRGETSCPSTFDSLRPVDDFPQISRHDYETSSAQSNACIPFPKQPCVVQVSYHDQQPSSPPAERPLIIDMDESDKSDCLMPDYHSH